MTTVEALIRHVLSELGCEASPLLAEQWVNERYQELANTYPLRHLRQVVQVPVRGVITTGTVSVTANSTTVTGNVDASAAWASLVNDRPWLLRVGNGPVWYAVSHFEPGQIILLNPYLEATTTDQSYTLLSRYTPLPLRTRRVLHVQHKGQTTLAPLSLTELFQIAPDPLVADDPQHYADGGLIPDGRRALILHPTPKSATVVQVTLYQDPPWLTLGDAIPDGLDPEALKQGVMVNAYRYEMHRAIVRGDFNGAAVLRNEMRSLMTDWEAYKRRAAQNNMLVDDVTWQVQPHPDPIGVYDVRTAWAHVWRR